ncbi:tyrosine-type recombinase/integrase [Saccharopolyspora shandongensis]|uniref:tyrosine-type recombinase/integrase n=1 Tax=Saccharopolyspora shandongensis TaxID=418495 RepID=UPI0033E9D7A8
MASPSKPRKRSRGEIHTLPSGSLRVRVYAGIDPLTGKKHHLTEVIPAGTPNAAKAAEQARTRLLAQVDERRNPKTRATVNQLLTRYMELHTAGPTTVDSYETFIRNHIRPLLGDLQVGRIDGEILDSFYKQLRTCRAHCQGRRYVEHRTNREHECDKRCRPHECRPLADGSLRKIQSILVGAGKRAVRWGWVGTNPFELAEPLPVSRPNPQPPTAEQAAAIVTEASSDLDWGLLVWLLMVTGMRRGEVCALKWDRIEFQTGVLTIRTSIAQRGKRTWEKDTKTHQQRRITLDEQTLSLLRVYRQHCAERAGLGAEMPESVRIFSPLPDGSTWVKPDTVSQRYVRMCARLGWDMNIHQLRHYSATELIAAGVDVRTVAGRLGHGGGGTTTLRVYSAWVAEADQRAAGSLVSRMPELPVKLAEEGEPWPEQAQATAEDDSPYKQLAADLRGAIMCGAFQPGSVLPPVKDLATRYRVSFGTAQRAIAALRAAGLVAVSRGRRATVVDPSQANQDTPAAVVSLEAKRQDA